MFISQCLDVLYGGVERVRSSGKLKNLHSNEARGVESFKLLNSHTFSCLEAPDRRRTTGSLTFMSNEILKEAALCTVGQQQTTEENVCSRNA